MSVLEGMFALPFIDHALIAGTAIAAVSGLVGYFMVLRGQVFAGDALSHVAYVGALAALATGIDLQIGLYAATIAAGAALGWLGARVRVDDVTIGTAFSWVLGLGVFFLSVFTTRAASANSNANVTVLFGSLFGISAGDARDYALIAVAVMVLVVVSGRPLLFASLDPVIAAARGVPVRVLGIGFLAVVGATAAEASRAVGALLLLGLLAAPAAAAQRLTSGPWPGMALAVGLSVAAVWIGVATSFLVPSLPPSFTIMTVAALEYVFAAVVGRGRTRARQRRVALLPVGGPRAQSPAGFRTEG